jgi:DNA polymerase-3 subunit delta'
VGFASFHGNGATVANLRAMIASGRVPNGIVLAGPDGSGKYTLALMLTKALRCLRKPITDGLPDFCGECESCVRLAQCDDLAARVEEAVTAREEMRDADKKDTRILIQSDPDVLIIPPDPPQLLIKLGQVRTVIERSQRHPNQGDYRMFIFTSAKFMKEAANSLLKVLEEPSPFAHFFLLAENPGELLPTICSRSALFRLHPVEPESIAALLAKERPTWSAQQRELVAKLTEGSVGRALSFDLAAYQAARADALLLLSLSLEANDHSALFKATEAYRGGADGQQKTIALLRSSASLLEDMMMLQHGAEDLVRNRDIQPQLARLASQVSFDWLDNALQGLAAVESGMRRNLLRNLSLDAYAARLENA